MIEIKKLENAVTKAGNPKDNWVDGISGATLTGRGVSNMIQFWLGEQGYKPYLDQLRKESGETLVDAEVKASQSPYKKLGQNLHQQQAHPVTELVAVASVAHGKEA